jgi:hypothetical protein
MHRPEAPMGVPLNELLASIDQALASLKSLGEAKSKKDIENLVRVKRVLEGLDPDEVDALLEDEDE